MEWHVPRNGLIDDHTKCVTVRRLRHTTLVEPELLRSNQLRTHPSNCAALAVRAGGYQVCRVRHDREQPKVSEASMVCFIDQYVQLEGSCQVSRMILAIEDTHPFDIAMDHTLSMKVYQSLSGVHQLEDLRLSQSRRKQSRKRGTYKSDPVCIWMCFNELVDISVCHPLRYHGKPSF